MNHPDPPESKLNIEKQRCVFMLYTSGASFRRTVRRLLNEPFSTHPDSVQIGKNTETQSPHSPYIQNISLKTRLADNTATSPQTSS